MSSEHEVGIKNGAFTEGWDDLPPVGTLVNQQPRGWQLRWLEPGAMLWDSVDQAGGVPECVHKHKDQLPPHEQPGQPEALILVGEWVYKIFHAGAPFGAELRQVVSGLAPGAPATVRAPVLIDGHGDADIFGAEAGLWVNGQGAWRNLEEHGNRTWHTHAQTVTVPPDGTVEVVLRFKSKWPAPKDFFIDDIRLEAVPAPVEEPAGETVGEALPDADQLRLGLMSWPGYPVIPAEPGAGPLADTTTGAEPVTEGLLVNGSFEDGWDDLPPTGDNLINQQPKGWQLTWLEPGQTLWDGSEPASGIPECVHKHKDQLPPHEHPGQPEALILAGAWVYKIFHAGASFGAELRQVVSGLAPGTSATARAPVLIDAHGDADSFSAEAGLWVNGQGAWHNLEQHGNRAWHTHAQTVTVPDSGTVEVVIRVKSKWPNAKDFFIDAVQLEAVPTVVTPPEEAAHFLTPTDFELKVRSGAGLEHSILTVVNPGDRLTVLEDWAAASAKLGVHGEWINLRAPDGVAGWSAAWILEPFAEEPPEAVEHFLTPTDFELKVRSGPGLQHSILSVVNPGDRLAVLEDWAAASAKLGVHGEWINLRAPDGVAGWSAAWILKPFAETPPPTDGLYPAPMNAFQITQPFSGADGHWGIDYGAAKGEPVFCGPAGGFVIRAHRCTKCTSDKPSVLHHGLEIDDAGVLSDAAWGWGFGHHVIVRYLNDMLPGSIQQALADRNLSGAHLFCMYAHLDSLNVKTGDMLAPGAQIGTCGETGNARGVHLHLEVRAGFDPDMKQGFAPLLANLLNPDLLFAR